MTLSPGASWALVVIVFAGTLGVLYLASRPSWTHRRRHRLHEQHLQELARHERARAAIARAQSQSNVRIPPRSPEGPQ